MSETNRAIDFFTTYLHEVYVNENLNVIDKIFHINNLSRGEFGEALGGSGIKIHARNWLNFFKVTAIDIEIKNADKGLIICDYFETAQQRAVFKTIVSAPTKTIKIKNTVALAITEQHITHYCLTKDYSQLILQLVNSDQEKYKHVSMQPIFKNLYYMHIKVITEHLSAHGIYITEPQTAYLCGYFVGAIHAKSREIFGLPLVEDQQYELEIQKLFGTSDEYQIRDKLREMRLAELLVEGYNLLSMPSLPFYNASLPCYGVPMYLTDNSKYLL